MTRTIPANTLAAVAGEVREPRYQIIMTLPVSGVVQLITGDPTRHSFSGTNSHNHADVDRVSWRECNIAFNLAEATFVPDLVDNGLLGSPITVYKYYELTPPTLVADADRVEFFRGVILQAPGGTETALMRCGLRRNKGLRRFNASGNFTVLTKPGVIHLAGVTVTIGKGNRLG